jgi:phage head maturation protease
MTVDKMHFALKDYRETDPEYPGTFSVVLSTPTLDRDNEVVEAKCFTASKSLPDRISMDLDHGLDVLSTVGSGTPSYNDAGDLVVDGTWSTTEKAQTARTLVREGHIAYTSVAYRTLKTKMVGGVRHIVDAELLNGTFTQIPANPTARVLVAKAGARNSKSDAEHIQAAHDALAAIGAACVVDAGKSLTQVRGKAIVGSVEALRERVADALEDAYPSDYGGVYVRGVILNGAGGTVVFGGYGIEALEDDETYSVGFTDDGAVVSLTGDVKVVDIAEIVTPDADAAREEAEMTAKSTAPDGAPDSAPMSAEQAAELMVRTRLARNALVRINLT